MGEKPDYLLLFLRYDVMPKISSAVVKIPMKTKTISWSYKDTGEAPNYLLLLLLLLGSGVKSI
jgi:hypothetical protein